MSKFRSDDKIDTWISEVKDFIRRNYYVNEVTLYHLMVVFNWHGGESDFTNSIFKNTFHSRNNRRPPTKKMQEMFERLKGYETAKLLHSFYDMPLRLEHRTPETIYDPERYFWDPPRSEIKFKGRGRAT